VADVKKLKRQVAVLAVLLSGAVFGKEPLLDWLKTIT